MLIKWINKKEKFLFSRYIYKKVLLYDKIIFFDKIKRKINFYINMLLDLSSYSKYYFHAIIILLLNFK